MTHSLHTSSARRCQVQPTVDQASLTYQVLPSSTLPIHHRPFREQLAASDRLMTRLVSCTTHASCWQSETSSNSRHPPALRRRTRIRSSTRRTRTFRTKVAASTLGRIVITTAAVPSMDCQIRLASLQSAASELALLERLDRSSTICILQSQLGLCMLEPRSTQPQFLARSWSAPSRHRR